MQQAEIGIIGGSGLYSMPGLTNAREETVSTPFGEPSDAFVLGDLEAMQGFFFSGAHGRGTRLLPSRLNFLRNIYAMKMLSVERVLPSPAVVRQGEHKPPDFAGAISSSICTFHRTSTFFW